MYADIGITQTESSQRPCVDNQEIDNDCDNDYDYEGQLRVMAELRSSQAAGQAVPPYLGETAVSDTGRGKNKSNVEHSTKALVSNSLHVTTVAVTETRNPCSLFAPKLALA